MVACRLLFDQSAIAGYSVFLWWKLYLRHILTVSQSGKWSYMILIFVNYFNVILTQRYVYLCNLQTIFLAISMIAFVNPFDLFRYTLTAVKSCWYSLTQMKCSFCHKSMKSNKITNYTQNPLSIYLLKKSFNLLQDLNVAIYVCIKIRNIFNVKSAANLRSTINSLYINLKLSQHTYLTSEL